MTMSLIFVGICLWLGWAAPHAGLALAGSLGAFVNAGLLFYYLHSSGVYRPGSHWPKLLARIGTACVVMGGVLYLGAGDTMEWISKTMMYRVLWLVAWIGIGMGTYFAILAVLGVRPEQFRLVQNNRQEEA